MHFWYYFSDETIDEVKKRCQSIRKGYCAYVGEVEKTSRSGAGADDVERNESWESLHQFLWAVVKKKTSRDSISNGKQRYISC